MTEVADASTWSSSELLAAGRRHLVVKDYTSAVESLANACELLAKEHGDSADQCAEAYLWYGKALLGLSREESGVLGDGVPGTGNADEEEENDEDEDEDEETGEAEQNGEAVAAKKNGETNVVEKSEAESTTPDEPGSSNMNVEPGSSTADAEPSTANGDADESCMNVDDTAAEEVDNLQLAWEMLDLARNILMRRAAADTGAATRALLADVHLSLGEVALESETYDTAVVDMQSCLEIQKELYGSDDRRIAETHYQIGLANYLASSFEDAITHFKNAANILESRIKTLENPASASDATVKKHSANDPHYTVEAEIKELKELLPEIQEKIQDMMDYKAETIKRMRESFAKAEISSNGASSSASSSQSTAKVSDITHLIKRKRKPSDGEADSPAKKINT